MNRRISNAALAHASLVAVALSTVLITDVIGRPGPGPDAQPTERSSRDAQSAASERARIQEELDRLGPSGDERLAQLAVDAETSATIRRQIWEFSYMRRRGSAVLIRRNRRNRVLREHGLLAFPFLVEALSGERYWSARVSAQAITKLARSKHAQEVRWLAYHLDVPALLIALYARELPDLDRVGLQHDTLAALSALTQDDVRSMTPAPSDLHQEWSNSWKVERRRWVAEEREREAERIRLRTLLETAATDAGSKQ